MHKNTIGEIRFNDINNEYGNFTKLVIENYGRSMIPGEPELPVFKTLIENMGRDDFPSSHPTRSF